MFQLKNFRQLEIRECRFTTIMTWFKLIHFSWDTDLDYCEETGAVSNSSSVDQVKLHGNTFENVVYVGPAALILIRLRYPVRIEISNNAFNSITTASSFGE